MSLGLCALVPTLMSGCVIVVGGEPGPDDEFGDEFGDFGSESATATSDSGTEGPWETDDGTEVTTFGDVDTWGDVDTVGDVDTFGDTWGETFGETEDAGTWGETFGDTFGETFGETYGDTFGETFGDTFGETTFGDTFGETFGDTWGETFGDTFGETFGDTFGETTFGDTFGETFGDTYGDTFGETFGETDTDTDTGGQCDPDFIVDTRRSLIETSPEAMEGVSMGMLLSFAASTVDLVADPGFTHARLMDSFNTQEGAFLEGGSHCDDELVDGQPGLNGYPMQCPRIEGAHAPDFSGWFPIAFVNRFDLAAADGSDCGEQRVIMANNNLGRAFVIFEARIPNPDPECGIAACAPVAEFWANQSTIDDPVERGEQLRQAFASGHPELTAAGFEPFISGANMTFGSGQIRTNSFDDLPWTLRQFEFVTEGDRLGVVQVPVSDNSFAPVWNDQSGHPAGLACRASILANLDGLVTDNTARMGLSLAPICGTAESADDGGASYASALLSGSGAFEADIADKLAELGSDLSPVDIANRAAFASNCMGCHESATGLDLGHGVQAPFSMGFVHVEESFLEECDGGPCFAISQALRDDFLPDRQEVFQDFMAQFACEAVCEQSNPEAIDALFEGPATQGLPDAFTPMAELLEWEQAFEAGLAQKTIAGRPRSVH
ncbi:hypothetical protein PPSIR1_04028 [Plesiocystis pacifica SIR-1]|uniref:Uncharacterized protein n=1 Tax=Plesiocystis pacifica SIR-1 TaxID=391625 RepID=A6G4G4_9BACT|nr:hypothetical protein PPSIR1_04028 [Plesiocystis pacifica SIR-1]